MAAPKGNRNAEKWTLEEAKKESILSDVLNKIDNREIQYLSELNLYFNVKNGGGNYILKKLNIREEVKKRINSYQPDRPCLYKNKIRGCKSKINKAKSKYITRRRNECPLYKLTHNFKVLFRAHFKNKNGSHTFKYLGYSVDDLKKHLEKLFDNKMNWDNYGTYWHIDHIKPCSLFNHSIKNELIECWSLSNLQPLEAKENMSKGNRYEL